MILKLKVSSIRTAPGSDDVVIEAEEEEHAATLRLKCKRAELVDVFGIELPPITEGVSLVTVHV